MPRAQPGPNRAYVSSLPLEQPDTKKIQSVTTEKPLSLCATTSRGLVMVSRNGIEFLNAFLAASKVIFSTQARTFPVEILETYFLNYLVNHVSNHRWSAGVVVLTLRILV